MDTIDARIMDGRASVKTAGRKAYERLLGWYLRTFPPSRYYARDLAHFGGLSAIADIGCGHGLFMESAPDRVTGLDRNPDSVAVCRQKGLNCIEGSCLSLPFEDGSMMGVYCSHVIEHLDCGDAQRLVGEIDRVLGKGGRAVIKSPMPNGHFFDDPTHVKPYPPSAVINLFGMTGGQDTALMKVGGYRVLAVEWDRALLYTPTVAPSSAPEMFRAGLALRGASVLLAQFGIRRLKKVAYTLVLEKTA